MAKKILIVDDEDEIIFLVESRLKANGYNVISCGNGREGLQKAREDKPDLIISDIAMPEMDGFEFYRELKKDSEIAAIPFLVLSAKGKREDDFRSLGVNEFINKPFDAGELIEKVKDALSAPPKQPALVIEKEEKPEPQSNAEEKAPEPKPQPAPPDPQEDASAQSFKAKILLATKEDSIIRRIGKVLRTKKCGVAVISHGNGLVEHAVDVEPKVIVLDGLIDHKQSDDKVYPVKEIIEKIKKNKKLKRVPIVAFCVLDKETLSADISPMQRQMDIERAKTNCGNAGVKDFLPNFEEAEFGAMIEKYLND